MPETTLTYAPCDRMASLLLGYKKLGINATIIGSAPIKQTKNGAVIGDQPVRIYLDEPIVAQYTNKNDTPDQYCDTPWRYFSRLSQVYRLNLSLIKVCAIQEKHTRSSSKLRLLGFRLLEYESALMMISRQ